MLNDCTLINYLFYPAIEFLSHIINMYTSNRNVCIINILALLYLTALYTTFA